MGTRGLMGFVVDGQVKATYNHFDSYPSYLGKMVGQFAATLADGDRLGEYVEKARTLRLVKEDGKPSAADRKKFASFAENVGNNPGLDWYSVLRGTQGDLEIVLDTGVMIDSLTFAYDSLFCEWGYLVNLDNGMIEVYRGFQQDSAAVEGRFAQGPSDRGYSPITLLGQIPFTRAGDADWWDALEAAVYSEEDADEKTVQVFVQGVLPAAQ